MNCNKNCCDCCHHDCCPCHPPYPHPEPHPEPPCDCECDTTIAIGTVTTLPPGSQAYVNNSGTDCEAVFNFGIPAGATGVDGANGDAATITIGTVTTGAPGTNASVTNSGTSSDAVFNFVIPRGDTGNCECQCRSFGTFPVTNATLENNSLVMLAVGTVSPDSYTLSASKNTISLPGGCMHIVSFSFTCTGTTSLVITPVINGTSNTAYAQYSQVGSKNDNISVSGTFPVPASSVSTVAFKITLPQGTKITLSGVVTITGAGALPTI